MPIAVIGCWEPIRMYSNEMVQLVSHGVDLDTMQSISLPCDRYDMFVAKYCYYDREIGEYILKNDSK